MASIAEIVNTHRGSKPNPKAKFAEMIFDALFLAYEQAATFVTELEGTRGGLDVEHVIAMRNHHELCTNLNQTLSTYATDFAGISELVNEFDENLDTLGNRFFERREKKFGTISVADACEVYKRSKSTIYRWIKAGKLQGEKTGPRRSWVIFV